MTGNHVSTFRLVVSLLTIGIAAAASSPGASAQKRTQPVPPWTDHFEAQIEKVITTPDRDIQEDGLATLLAVLQNAPPGIDARSLAPAVLRVVRDESTPEGLRIMALSALDAIDSQQGYEALLQWVQSERPASERLQRHALLVLKSYQTRHELS